MRLGFTQNAAAIWGQVFGTHQLLQWVGVLDVLDALVDLTPVELFFLWVKMIVIAERLIFSLFVYFLVAMTTSSKSSKHIYFKIKELNQLYN